MDDDKRKAYVELVPDDAREETSTEAFDRVAFAERAVALVGPSRTRVAICRGVSRLQVASGRQWGAPSGSRWAMISVPPTASRRAIALAVAELSNAEGRPYAFDVLFGGRLAFEAPAEIERDASVGDNDESRGTNRR